MRNPSGGKRRLSHDSNRLPSDYTLEARFDHLRRHMCPVLFLWAGNRKENHISLLPALLQMSSHTLHSNIPHYTGYQPTSLSEPCTLLPVRREYIGKFRSKKFTHTLSFLAGDRNSWWSPHMLHVGTTKSKPVVATGNSDSANSIPSRSERGHGFSQTFLLTCFQQWNCSVSRWIKY
jgi:hypothetical protein